MERGEQSPFQRIAKQWSRLYEGGYYDDEKVVEALQEYAGALPDAELYELHNDFVFNPELQEIVGRTLLARLLYYEQLERGE